MTLPSAPSLTTILSAIKRRLGAFVVEGWQGRSGDEIYQAISRVFSQIAGRARAAILSAYLRRAEGASRHRTTVRLTWSESSVAEYTIGAGTFLFSTAWGARFRLVDDLVVGAVSAGATLDVEVEAEWAGFDYVVAPRTITLLLTPPGAPEAYVDAVESGELTVSNLADGVFGALGLPETGITGFLDLIAMERGLPRELGESDEALRVRIWTLPEMLTPAAILRVMTRAFNELVAELHPGLVLDELVMWEPWEYGYAPGVGAIGVHPPARSASFMLIVPCLPWDGVGYAPGAGAIGVHPIGVGDVARDGYYAGLQNQLDRIRAAGVWGQIYTACGAPEPEPEPEMLGFWRIPATGTSLVRGPLDELTEPTAEHAALAAEFFCGCSLLFWLRVLFSAEGGYIVEIWTGAEIVTGPWQFINIHLAAGGDAVITPSVLNYLMDGTGPTSAGFPFDEWGFISLETDAVTGELKVYRNAVLLSTTTGDPPDPGGEGSAPPWVRFKNSSNGLDVTNVLPLPRVLTSDERIALTAAGPGHDYRDAFDDGEGHVWAGLSGEDLPGYYYPDGVLESAGTAVCTMVLVGDATTEEEEP